MLLPSLICLLMTLPALVSAAIFPPNTKVKMLDTKGFKRAMRSNRTAVVAFVAPWCGHCQRMAPEYSKAAGSLNPLVPFYAALCAQQEVQGFPTIKVFPRGGQLPAQKYEAGERTENNFVKVFKETNDVDEWLGKTSDLPRVILLNKDKKFPFLWQVLANNYYKKIAFGHRSDADEVFAESLGFVAVYPAGSQGGTSLKSLSKFFRSIVDGTADFLQESVRPPVKDEL
ncbi:thioredoxin-like protein [Pisolithus orientalis]|uniref:thioredoxin-like protein n=1 Tax=Pisolithus orientalis TaxID=936130 RepID=UPI0022257B9C|nr:thioredoxin-like protein [Pisolithus orientalis]KAI6001080.1 thioredoxin-like protein [Pisolithus orientalis]